MKKEMMQFNCLSFAHRGYFTKDQKIPENSILAFKEALKLHLGIELDVHLTKDRKVVVFHDDDLSRMCGVPKTVESLTFRELSELYLKNTSEKIPLLTEVLSLVNGRVPLLIELKLPTNDTSLCQFVHEILSAYHGPYLIQSFNTLGLSWYRKNAPMVLRGQLSSNLMDGKEKNAYLLRILVRFLLLNRLGSPDFISYKYKDRKNISLFLMKFLFRVPIAVWTLRKESDYKEAKKQYNIMIFERFHQG